MEGAVLSKYLVLSISQIRCTVVVYEYYVIPNNESYVIHIDEYCVIPSQAPGRGVWSSHGPDSALAVHGITYGNPYSAGTCDVTLAHFTTSLQQRKPPLLFQLLDFPITNLHPNLYAQFVESMNRVGMSRVMGYPPASIKGSEGAQQNKAAALNLLASQTAPLGIHKPQPPSLFVFPASRFTKQKTRGGHSNSWGLPACKTCSPAMPSCVKLTLDEFDYVYNV